MKRASIIFIWLTAIASPVFFSPARAASRAILITDAMNNEDRGIVALAQTLREMTNPYTVMCIAARPADADFATLAYYHHKFGARVCAVIATRGDSEESQQQQTSEALKKAYAVGADTYFLNLADFGYAKSIDEALQVWGRDEVLSRLVQAIRSFHPDVIITPHNADGQQRAIASTLVDAFDAAADVKQFPDTASEAWQVKRLFQQVTEGYGDVILNPHEYDALRGRTYAETADTEAPERIIYKLSRSASGERLSANSTLLSGLLLPEKIRRGIEPPSVKGQLITESAFAGDDLFLALVNRLLEKRAEGSLSDIKTRYGADYFRMVQYIDKLERAIALTLGIRFAIRLPDKTIAQGEPVNAYLEFKNGGVQTLSLVFHTLESLSNAAQFKTSEVINVAPNGTTMQTVAYETANLPLTLPRNAENSEERFYQTSRFDFSNQPFGKTIGAYVEINLGQTTINIPALAKFDIAAPIEMEVSPPIAFLKDWSQAREFEFTVRVRNRMHGTLQGALWVVPLALETTDYEPSHLRFAYEDEEAVVKLKLKLPILKPPLATDVLLEFRREQPASPSPLVSYKIPVKILDADVAPGLKVGYFSGDDSPLPSALAALGIASERLTTDELRSSQQSDKSGQPCGILSRFDVTIIDALTFSKELAAQRDCLMDYVKRGGSLIVFYQRPNFWTSLFSRNNFAPYPLTLSNERITDENSTVTIVDAEHPLLTKPNRIMAKDFEGWTEDRAHYTAKSWANEYTPLLESADKDEAAQRGLLLFTRYGEGSFTFTSLALPRQLANLNTGAYRLLANLLSLPKALKEQKDK